MRAPVATKHPTTSHLHGVERQDDYAWLRDKEAPEVRAYLEEENAYAEAWLEPLSALRRDLYDELLGRIQQTDTTVPYREGDHYYYSRTVEGSQYSIHCRKLRSLDAPEQVVLDLNEMAQGKPFLSIGSYEVSSDGHRLAYTIDETGFREYTLRVQDLRTGRDFPDPIERVSSVEWAADGRTLFYVTDDDAKRPFRLYRHQLGSQHHELVYEETDPLFRLFVGRTHSRQFLLLYSSSHTTSEVRILRSDRPKDDWRTVAPRVAGREYDVEHHGRHLYLRINDTGRNFRVVTAPIADPREEAWQEVLPHRPDVMVEGIDLFARHYVVYEREDGLPHIRVGSLIDGKSHRIAFDESVYSLSASYNPAWDTGVLRFSYQSPTTPPSVFDYDMESRERTRLKQMPVLGGFDSDDYVAERLFARADDGTRIPISLVRRKDAAAALPGPLLLAGYGSYGYPYPVVFSSNRLSLLDRGVTFAIAHIRGGGEMGKSWHDAGRMMSKRNTFTDFIAAAEHLVEHGHTTPERLVIEGGSAGGLLMGAVVNLRPDLFGAVVSHVPFVDVLNTMLDASLPLTVGEYEEWGNPNEREAFEYMATYCPYTNLRPAAYPSMLVKTSLNDSQVMYWEPAKYVARLRDVKTDSNPLLLVTNMGAGHSGASGRYDRLEEIAFDFAFILERLGVTDPVASTAG